VSFTARFRGWCNGCQTKIEIGDECDRDRGKVVHRGCASTAFDPAFDDRSLSNTERDHDNQEPPYVVINRPNHERRCGGCHLIHAGECY
jgi:hypothetical protein